MSFKQRRDSRKEQTGKSDLESTQNNVDSLSRKSATTLGRTQAKINSGISSLKDTRNKTKTASGGNEEQNMALSAEIDDL